MPDRLLVVDDVGLLVAEVVVGGDDEDELLLVVSENAEKISKYRQHIVVGVAAGGADGQQQHVVRFGLTVTCLLYTSPSPRDKRQSRMPSSA